MLTNGDLSVTLVTMSDGLIEELIRIQKERDWSDQDMAEHLGVSRPMWSMVKAGDRHPGRKFLRGVKRGFPYLDMNLFFSERGHDSERQVPISNQSGGEASNAAA